METPLRDDEKTKELLARITKEHPDIKITVFSGGEWRSYLIGFPGWNAPELVTTHEGVEACLARLSEGPDRHEQGEAVMDTPLKRDNKTRALMARVGAEYPDVKITGYSHRGGMSYTMGLLGYASSELMTTHEEVEAYVARLPKGPLDTNELRENTINRLHGAASYIRAGRLQSARETLAYVKEALAILERHEKEGVDTA